MLKHSAEALKRRQCGRETPAVVASLVTPSRFDEPGEATPTGTRRVRDDRPGARVSPRVARFRPRVDAWLVHVGAAAVDEQRGDVHARRHDGRHTTSRPDVSRTVSASFAHHSVSAGDESSGT